MTEPSSILVIQTAFIGDAILATGLLESLHQRYPDASIDYLVRKGNEDLFKEHPFVRKLWVFDKSRKYSAAWELIKSFRREHYDLVINVQRFATTGLITLLAGARVTVGFDKNPLSRFFTHRIPHLVDGRHETERNHALIAGLVGGKPAPPRLYPLVSMMDKVSVYAGVPYLTVSPASVWFTKQYPAEQWVDFLQKVQDRVYLLGAPSDKDRCEEIAARSGGHVKSLAGQLTLLESAALMKGARMNYVNDSAPMHLASAMNAPVTAVYCSTVPNFGFGPLSSISHVVETKEKLSCRPCGLHGYRQCPQGHFRCATDITADRLLATLDQKA